MSRVVLHRPAIKSLGDEAGIRRGLEDIGHQIADRAAHTAPKATGAGAASITAEVGQDGQGAYVRVSWDAQHFYMYFHEVGTSKMSAHPFLRPALDAAYHL